MPPKEAIITFTDELVVNGQSTKETKRPLSHLSPTLREGERGGGGCQSNHSRVYGNSGGLSSPEAKTHCLKWKRNEKRKRKKELSQEILQLGLKYRLEGSERRGVRRMGEPKQPPENLYGWR